MYSEPSMITFAEAHQQTLLNVAANARPLSGTPSRRPARPSLGITVRQYLGPALIALGTRLQADLSVSAGSMPNLQKAH